MSTGRVRPHNLPTSSSTQVLATLPPEVRCQKGLARTFQKSNLFADLSVFENVRLALQSRRGNSFDFFTPVRSLAGQRAFAEEVLDSVRLLHRRSSQVSNLSYGERRQLEIALALATEPDVILLDEPTSGMSPAETGEMINLVAGLPEKIAVILVEHDMHVVHSLAHVVTVLHQGSVLVTGSAEAVSRNAQVREVYLGTGLTSDGPDA